MTDDIVERLEDLWSACITMTPRERETVKLAIDEIERLRASKPTIEYHCSGGHFIVASVTTLEGQACNAPGCQGIVGAPETDLTKRIRMQREEIRTLHELSKRAADEVERLRAKVKQYEELVCWPAMDDGTCACCDERRALKETP